MKKTIFTFIAALVLIVFFNEAFAQVPQGFNYQAVARNTAGTLLQNQLLAVKLSLHQGSASGTVVYSERQTPTTNQFGLFTVTLGQGTLLSGAFNTILWSSGNYWLQVELDVTGGTTYTDMGTSQLLTVPFAMYAASGVTGAVGPTGPAGPAGVQGATGPAGPGLPTGTSGQTLRHDGTSWIANSNLYNNGTNIGIGTSNPAANSLLHVNAASGYALARFTSTTTGIGSGDGFVVGQNTSAGDVILYNFEAQPIRFGTNSIERMRIDASGNIGIGTATPTAQLHTTGSLLFAGAGTPGDGKVLTSDASGNATWQPAVTSYSINTTAATPIASTTIASATITTLLQLTGVPAGAYAVYFSSPITNSSVSSSGINLVWAVTANNASPNFPAYGIANSFIPASGWTSNYPFGQSGYCEVTLAATGTIELKATYYGTVTSGLVNLAGANGGKAYLRAIKL